MSKFTLFTLFLSAVIVVIVAELLVDDYIKNPAKNLQANVLNTQVQNSAPGTVNNNVAPNVTPAPQTLPVSPNSIVNPPADSSIVPAVDGASPKITFALVSASGFQDVTLQRSIFNGLLFEMVDIQDSLSTPVIQQHLLKNNTSRIATFYEFPFGNKGLSGEFYLLLKQKVMANINLVVNETNGFGEGSFYVNSVEHPEWVFLVVKKGNNVYALTYLKEYHPLVMQLLGRM